MYLLEVLYLGKTYEFTAGDSITLADLLETQFGKIVDRFPKEGYTRYVTVRGAQAWMGAV